jgi:hypothetical protein
MFSPLLPSWPAEAKAALLAGAILVAAAAVRVLMRRAAFFPPRLKHNGIAVGDTKVYDNRSLVLMLDQLKDQLKELQKLDATKPWGAIGTQQAASSASTTVSGTIASGSKDAGKPDTGGGGSGDAKAAGAEPPKLSERPSDLLADQVNLNYDIFNLQLLLERAISDRIMPMSKSKSGEQGQPQGAQADLADTNPTRQTPAGRVQAVLGIPVSLDPPAYAAGCAAVVEVWLKADYPLSLVVLFPQEDTYNTAISSHRRASFSASANQPGTAASGTFDSARDSSAIRREVDTVAFQRVDDSLNELVFGWEFFPGAGRPSVAPGMRQMLAVVSLAQADDGSEPVKLSIQTRTRWRKFDSATLTVTDHCGWRVLLTNRPADSGWSVEQLIEVLKTDSIEDGLHPVVDDIECYRVGETAVVVVKGDNFFPGTSVVMGDKVHDSRENDLILKSSRVMQIQAPLRVLASAAVLNGRYGISKELCIDPVKKFQIPLLAIRLVQIVPAEPGFVVRLQLGLLDGTRTPPLGATLLRLPRPVLAIDGVFISSDVTYSENPSDDGQGVDTWANISMDKSAVRSPASMVLRLTFPLCGPAWSLVFQTYDIRQGVTVIRHVEDTDTRLLFSGAIFAWEPSVAVWLGGEYNSKNGLNLVRVDLMELVVPTALARSYNWLFVFGSWGSARIDIQDAPGSPTQPAATP